MNIICDRLKLMDGINISLKAVPGKSTMAILECLVIEAKNGIIRFISNNLEIGIETVIEGNIIEDGSAAVNAKLFFGIVRNFSSDEVSIIINDTIMDITCGKATFHIPVKDTEEFPYLPKIVKKECITISQFTLKEVIRQTVFSVSDNENTKVMTGELFKIKDSQLQVASLDGHRISIRKVNLKEKYNDISAIIPGKTLVEISKILNGDIEEEIHMYFTDRHILFELTDTIMLSRLIEGEYYKIEKMVSSDYETKITVNKKNLFNCINRTTPMLQESEKKPVILHVKDTSMELAINTGNGSMLEEIDITKEGKDILIGFNPKFLMDALRVIDEEEITMYMINPKAPCFIRDLNETYIYLILPVNFN